MRPRGSLARVVSLLIGFVAALALMPPLAGLLADTPVGDAARLVIVLLVATAVFTVVSVGVELGLRQVRRRHEDRRARREGGWVSGTSP